jgi:hypothetical protein
MRALHAEAVRGEVGPSFEAVRQRDQAINIMRPPRIEDFGDDL